MTIIFKPSETFHDDFSYRNSDAAIRASRFRSRKTPICIPSISDHTFPPALR